MKKKYSALPELLLRSIFYTLINKELLWKRSILLSQNFFCEVFFTRLSIMCFSAWCCLFGFIGVPFCFLLPCCGLLWIIQRPSSSWPANGFSQTFYGLAAFSSAHLLHSLSGTFKARSHHFNEKDRSCRSHLQFRSFFLCHKEMIMPAWLPDGCGWPW